MAFDQNSASKILAKSTCVEKMAFLEAWNNAATKYSQSVSRLMNRRLGDRKFETKMDEAEIARQEAYEARSAFHAHLKEHGC